MEELGGMYLQRAYIRIRKQALEEKKPNIAEAAGRRLSGGSVAGKSEDTIYQFEVPFNPAELHISSQEGTIRKKTDLQVPKEGSSGEQNTEKTIAYETVKPRKTLSVKLIFDETQNAMTGVTFQVEGFLAAVRSPRCRMIFFDWHNFAFAGSLEQVSAQYTMFSPQGIPLRAEVTLRITKT